MPIPAARVSSLTEPPVFAQGTAAQDAPFGFGFPQGAPGFSMAGPEMSRQHDFQQGPPGWSPSGPSQNDLSSSLKAALGVGQSQPSASGAVQIDQVIRNLIDTLPKKVENGNTGADVLTGFL